MKKLLAIALLATAGSAWAQAPQGSAERGRKTFMTVGCYTCHGMVGQGGERGAGPKLAPNPFPYEAFAFQMRHPRANMPRYGAEFVSDQDVADIYAYMTSIKPGAAAKDIPLLNN
jgi:ubiquinol-cytochrome c reductase cytochrome c subunit